MLAFQAGNSPALVSNNVLLECRSAATQELRQRGQMTDSVERAIEPEPGHPAGLLEQAINDLSLGLIIFDNKREVVFCNKRYTEIYGLSADQVKPGTPTSELIQHRLNLGLKVPSEPDDYIRERGGGAVVPGMTVHEFTDGRIIAYAVYPM